MNPTILYVDDSSMNRVLFERMVERYLPGVTLLQAEDSASARAAAGSGQVDCAILDLMLANESGIDLCREWKRSKAPVHFPVMLITAQDCDFETRLAGLEAGADDFIIRPVEHVELAAKIRVLLRVKRAEDELRSANRRLAELAGQRAEDFHSLAERFYHVFETCSDGILVFEVLDESAVVREVNEAMCRFLRMSRDSLQGKPVLDLLPDDRRPLLASRIESILSKTRLYFETELIPQDGRRIRLAVYAKVIRDQNRTLILCVNKQLDTLPGATGATSDYGVLANQTGQIIYETDVDTLHTRLAGAVSQVTGLDPSEIQSMQGGKWIGLIHPEDTPRVVEQFQRALYTLSGYRMEYRLRHKSGDYRTVEDLGVVIPDDKGISQRVVGTLRDITQQVVAEEERRRAEQEQQHSQRLESLGVLAGGIAHDFNNILSGIIGMTDLSLDDIPKNTPLHEDLTEVLQGAHRAKELVKQILAFSRQSTEERSPLYLHVIVREALRLIRASLPANIRIIDSIDVHSGAILSNAAQMHQVFTNFCTNAAQAMPQGGTLEVVIKDETISEERAAQHPRLHPGNFVRLTVHDTGHGMSPAIVARIFDPFFTTKRPGEGTGMGLAVVHGIVSSHGGFILVESKPERGTTFHTYFPRVDSVPTPAPQKEATPTRGKERVLVVDDEDAVLKLASAGLPRLGYEVQTFSCPEKALAHFEDDPQRYNVVITDFMMPKMTGDVFAGSIKRTREDIPVILFTGFSDQITEQRAQAAGVSEIILKPIVIQELAQSIRRILG